MLYDTKNDTEIWLTDKEYVDSYGMDEHKRKIWMRTQRKRNLRKREILDRCIMLTIVGNRS
jgi:hypothetical protein